MEAINFHRLIKHVSKMKSFYGNLKFEMLQEVNTLKLNPDTDIK